MFAKLKNNWLNASIRKKMMTFLVTVVVSISFFSILMLVIVYSYVNNFSGNVNEYFKINLLQQNNANNDRLIAKYLEDSRLDNLAEFNHNIDSFNAILQEIKAKPHSLEGYLLIRSIQNSFDSYCLETTLAIRKQIDGNKDYQTNYYNANKINQYLNGYIAQLLELSLSEGNTVYSRAVAEAGVAMLLLSLVIVGFLIICLIFGVSLSNYLTKPIAHLARLSIQMSEGDLDVRQVKISSHDEVGILARSFNKMSGSIKKLVHDLQEKAVVERRLRREEVKNAKNRELLEEARFLALQSQINPHFLFNTLNTVSRVITFNRSEEAIRLINALAGILRYNMGNSKLYVRLTDELEIIRQYVHIQQYRFGDRVNVEIDCSRIDADTVTIPCFSLQPIVENSVIHGLEPKVAGGRLRIRAYMDKDSAVIKVVDNGAGIPPDKLKAVLQMKDRKKTGRISSIGLSNVMQRLAIFCGKHGGLSIRSKLGVGTVVIIRIPVRGKENV
jgi:two-component system sensor histidine kinase YesM